MATIGKELGLKLLKNNGMYEDDPQCDSIWSYIHQANNEEHFAIYYKPYNLVASQFVRNPTLLWSKDNGYTEAGKSCLN